MDINFICPAYKCNIMEFLPYFLDTDEHYEDIRIAPSRLLHELQVSTEERLERLCRPTRRKKLATRTKSFSAVPDIVIFQNFQAGHTYKAKLTLLNLKPVSMHLSIIKNSSPYFEVVHLDVTSSVKVAPGMTFSVYVVFKPAEFRDHVYYVKFMTEGETFSVPVHGLGQRPFLSLPDQISFSPTAVGVASQKSIVLHNFGHSQTCFLARCQEPCKVYPVRGSLKPNQISEIMIHCTPTNSRPVSTELHLSYEDIKLVIPMTCSVVKANIYLDTSSLIFDETFMGLQSNRKLTAYNCSQFVLDFKWKTCKSNAIEELERSKLVKAIGGLAELEKKKTVKLEYMNIIDAEGHSGIVDQELAHEIEEVKNKFLYKDDVFSILPVQGRILPNQCLEFTAIFAPRKNDHYTGFAYFDVTGIEERIPLCLSGGGRGPQVVINAKTLNVNDIFLNSTHEYQIVVKNDGNIPAVVSFVEKETEFGGVIECLPKRHDLLCRDICKTFVLIFCSKFQGKFVEKIQFMIEESGELIDMLFVGNVICPLLKPDCHELDFGEVSLGSQPSKKFVLINDSQVPIDFKLSLPGKRHKNGNPVYLEEFDFFPRQGVVEAFSNTDIKVTLTTQALQDVDATLVVSMWGSQRYSIKIPLRYKCLCPTIQCVPKEVYINFCFLNYEYKRTITLKNYSNVNGFLTYTPIENPIGITCNLNKTEFFVFSNEEIDIELTIQTDSLGTHEFPIIFTMAGSKPETICTVKCNGQGPVVSYKPDELQFGCIKLLNYDSRTLTLINDSPIIANITASTPPTSPFMCDVTHLEIAPEDTVELIVKGYLKDTGKYNENLNIMIENGEMFSVSILGEGIGSSILCEPIIDPEYNTGVLLTHQVFKLKVKLTNLGKKRYKIAWTRIQALKNFKELDEEDIPSVFRIEPNRFELGYNESQQIEIIGSSKKVQIVQEDFYCFALIDKSVKVTRIISCLMKAEFVEPNVRFSEWTLNFLRAEVDYPMYFKNQQLSSLTPLVDYDDYYRNPVNKTALVISNDTEAPLKVVMKTTSDYYINYQGERTTELNCELDVGDNYNAQIEFRPKIQTKRYSKITGRFTVDYSQHPKEDNINLIGEVLYPTVELVPNQYHFECLPLDSYTWTNVIIQNVTFMPLRYSWELLEDAFEIEVLESPKGQSNTCVRSSLKSNDSDEISKFDDSVETTYITDLSQSMSGMTATKKIVPKSSSNRMNKKLVSMAEIPKITKKHRGLTEEGQMNREASVVSEKIDDGSIEEIHLDWDYKTYLLEAKKCINNIAANHMIYEDAEFSSGMKNEQETVTGCYSLKNIVTIEPSVGVLSPYEYGAVTIGFFPPPDVKVKCTAICKVEGGEDETLLITGMSSGISYKFDKQVIEFGRKLYSEVCESTLLLTNTGYSKFHFKKLYSDEHVVYTNLLPRWLTVSPSEGSLSAGESAVLLVKYFPGKTGEFGGTISFEIGYLEPHDIQIHGYAGFSQLSLTLPREIPSNDWNELSYRAISSITEEYLLSFNDVKNDNITKYVHIHGRPENMDEVSYKLLLRDYWVVISENDIYPTENEIDLSRERTLLNDYLQSQSFLSAHTDTISRKVDNTSEFIVPPYILDFGYVIINKPVCYTVLIVNCGPVDTEVKLQEVNKNKLDNNELKIEFRNKRMGVGDMTQLYAIFSPSRKRCGPHEKRIEECIYLTVKSGERTPILIRATATTPTININSSCIEFGCVKIGSALRKSVVIHNDGNLLSKWSTEVRSLNEQFTNAYYIIPNKGELLPDQKDLLNIYWIPTKKGTNDSELTIRVERNNINTLVALNGLAVEPALAFSDLILNFGACLPYSEKLEKFLVVQNASAFPIEYCFSDIDRDYDEEKNQIELYLLYHNYDVVLIPERLPGYRLPEMFQSNYFFLMNQIREKLLLAENYDDEGSFDLESKYKKEEIFRLMIDHIDSIPGSLEDSNTDVCPMDDEVNSRTAIFDPEKQVSIESMDQRSGVFIIFHGGPTTNYYKAANRAGIALSMQVYSIDRLISEELVKNEVGPATEINNIIEMALTGYNFNDEKLLGEDDYDILWRKIRTLSDKKGFPTPRKLLGGAIRVKLSDKESERKSDKSNKAILNTSTLVDIPQELLIDLLKKRFDNTKTGIVIESLNSEFLRKPNIALDSLLHAIGSVKYIHIIMLSYTMDDYMNNELIRRKNEDQMKYSHSYEGTDNDLGTPRSTGNVKSKLKTDASKNYLKQISKDLTKDMKQQFESFSELLEEILHISEYWDRHGLFLMKPLSRANLTSKKDTKSSAKDSVPDSKSSNKKGRKTFGTSSVNVAKLNPENVGIYLWVISNCCDDRITDADIISTLLKCNSELIDAIAELEGTLNQIEESTTSFSVIRQIKKYPKHPNINFQISQPINDEQENAVPFVASSVGVNLRKKASKRKPSADRKDPSTTTAGLRVLDGNSETFRTRYILSPDEKAKYRISFSPPVSGTYSNNYLIELFGIDKPYSVQCHALCHLPTIDWNPEIMFPKCQETYRNKILGENFVYYKEEDVFDFGYIFIGTHKTQPYASKIVLKNVSQLLCEITAQVTENSLFAVPQENLSIGPGESEELWMTLKATKKGRIQSELFVTTKNIPEVKIIRLAAQACPVEVNIHPKLISFEKVPLNYSDKRKITLTNSSPVDLVWKFVKADWTLDYYNISRLSGTIKLYSVDEIIIEYFPTQEENNPKKSSEIQAFDLNHSDVIPVYKEDISILSDSVEYQVEYRSHIDLGDVKGKTQMKIPFHMSNNGKSNVTVVFSELDNILPEEMHHIRKFFKINTKTEVLSSQKSTAVMINFYPTIELHFENVPVFSCSFVENNNTENVISSFIITFSGAVHLSKFELCPASDLYFGYQQIGTAKTQKMEIRNIGKFPFEYAILSFEDTVTTDPKKRKSNEQRSLSNVNIFKKMGSAKSRNTSPKSKEKSKEQPTTKISKLDVPGFTIQSSNEIVLPNEVVQIDVESLPEELKEYESVLVIFVTECQKEDIFGRKVTLHVDGTEPRCNFEDYEKMFREHFIVQNLGNFICPENIGSHSVFVASERALYLKNICVNEIYSTKIYVQNLGQVTAECAIKLDQKNNFVVSPSTLFIPPYQTEPIFISFTPDYINKFENTLIISYNSSVPYTFMLSLIAESCVPQIALLEPTPGVDNIARIDFIPTYIHMTRSKRICIENVGALPCKLIMDFCDDKYKVFHLEPQGELKNFLNLLEKDEDFEDRLPSLMVNLLPQKKGYFDLVFKPNDEHFFNAQMKIHIVNNPFEVIKINLTGQSYYQDIYVDGLETFNMNKSNSSMTYIGYILDFGFSSLNKLLKKCFILKNNSQSSIYKFNFTHQSNLIITPKVGHLKPNTSKEIIAVISTKQPLHLQQVTIECHFISINYVDPDVTISWDDRQQIVDWENTGRNDTITRPQYYKEAVNIAVREINRSEPTVEEKGKCILYRSEPEHILLSNVWDVIPIFLSVTADYATYDCTVNELIFPETFVKEKSDVKFSVANNGLVPIHIEWSLNCDEISHQRASSARFQETSDKSRDKYIPPATSLTSSLSSTTLFSSTESETKTDKLPFDMIPEKTIIQPNETTTFCIVFSPLVSSQYYARLVSNISSLDPCLKNIDIAVTAESLVPECYFELEEMDYFTRRPPVKKCIEDRDDFKVVELTSVGVGTTSTRIFNIVNTSKASLYFTIELLDTGSQFSYFNCKTPVGIIKAGKKSEVAFSFIPQELGSFEEYYKFSIDSISYHRTLLLAGHCREPKIYFLKPHVTISPTLLGVPSEETVTLKNEEDTELAFRFLKNSLYNQEHDQRFKVTPMSGTVNPRSEFHIKLNYNAEKIGDVDFYLKCVLEKMKSHLNLTVSARCMEVLCSVSFVNKNGVTVQLDSEKENVIDLGNIGIKLKRVTKMMIMNIGQTGFFYGWKLNKKAFDSTMSVMVDSEKEFVSAGSSVSSDIIIESFRPYEPKDFRMKLEISYGPTYIIKLNTFAHEALCKFSFTSYNFGCCIVQNKFSKYNEVKLKAKNFENNPIMIQNQFENNRNLTVDFTTSQVPSNSSETIPIYFHPQVVGKYEITVPFIVKSMRKSIKLEGEGVKLNLQLMNPSDKFINLEPVKLGNKRRYSFELLNRTATKVEVILYFSKESPIQKEEDTDIEPEMQVPKEKSPSNELTKIKKKKVVSEMNAKNIIREKKNENVKIESQQKGSDVGNIPLRPKEERKSYIQYLMIHPKDYVTIEPNKKHEYVIEFNPKERIENFSEKIFYKVQDCIEPLSVVRGSCKAPEFALDKDILTFSNIILSCHHTRNVLLLNTGDTQGRFKWSFEEPIQDYKINPIEGVISPNSQIKINVLFRPSAVHCQLVKKAKCTINKNTILELKIIGNSLNVPQPITTVNFSCPVRDITTETITVTNSTRCPWTLNPVTSKDTFRVPKEIEIGPETSIPLEIQYRPQYMTKLKPEQATLFLPLPEGQAILYELVGTALSPLPAETFCIKFKCKENHTEILKIRNWQDTLQCYAVRTELMTEATSKTIYKTFGHNLIEVPPNKTWEYKWNVYVMNEEQLDMKVIFTNIETEEYLFYEISMKVLPSDPMEIIRMNTCVREQVKTTVELKNPINLPVTFNISGSPELQFEKTVSMKPYTVHNLDIFYCPLKCEDIRTNLEATCEELGTFVYVLELIANSPLPERVLKFKAELGDKGFNTISIKNTFAVPFELVPKVENSVFSVDKPALIPVGETGNITMSFEPSELGTVESKVILNSPVTGEYIYPLIGECVHPTPKGPFFIKPGGFATIQFENPFTDPKTFEFSIDSNMFTLKSTSEVIKPRKLTKIVVSLPMKSSEGTIRKYPSTAKLVAQCNDPVLKSIRWVFYIQSDQ